MTLPQQGCQFCSYDYVPDPKRAVMTVYARQPWFSYLSHRCPKCCRESKLFFGPELWQSWIDQVRAEGIGVMVEDFPDEATVEWWEQAYERQPLPEHSLTPRMEEEVAALATTLQAIPADLLWSVLAEPQPPRQRPENWT